MCQTFSRNQDSRFAFHVSSNQNQHHYCLRHCFFSYYLHKSLSFLAIINFLVLLTFFSPPNSLSASKIFHFIFLIQICLFQLFPTLASTNLFYLLNLDFHFPFLSILSKILQQSDSSTLSTTTLVQLFHHLYILLVFLIF